jgi:hypothetical protein
MTGSPIEELVVDYDVERVARRADRRRRLFRSRMISLAITVVIVAGLAIWLRSRGQPAALWLSGVIIVASASWAAVYYALFRRARRELSELGEGAAIRVSRGGVAVAGLAGSWRDVSSLRTSKGGLGRGPRLSLELRDGRTSSVALDQVSVLPATLDSTVRAYSGGRLGVDLTALDI